MDYETVMSCKKFMKDFSDVSLRYVYNPFTDRKVKKGTSTFTTLYHQVKRYLENLDDEEFHSPIKIEQLLVDVVPAQNIPSIDKYLNNNILESDTVNHEWFKKVEKKLKVLSETKEEHREEGFNLNMWKLDSAMQFGDFEIHLSKWIQSNPELYSFLDHYKPEIFKNKYITKYLIQTPYTYHSFVSWLQYSCDIFLKKSYESFSTAIPNDHRYVVSMIMFWIYQPFILNARKFLKKNKNQIEEFMRKIPSSQLKINKQQLCSIILAYFIRETKVEHLDNAKSNYHDYFEKSMKNAFQYITRENIMSRVFYRQLLTEFLSSRIKPYRYVNVKFNDLENFDKIVEYLDNPPKESEKLDDILTKDEVSDDE